MFGVLMQGQENTMSSGTDTRQLYKKIYLWHQTNKDKLKLPLQRRKKYLSLIDNLPGPEDASVADVAFVCNEVNDGLMAWSRDEKDERGTKIGDYAKKTIENLGGYFQAYRIAETSKLALKYWPKMSTLKKLLQHLSAEELRLLYIQYERAPRISKVPTKSFILRKIVEEIPSNRLFGNPKVSSMLSTDFEQLYSFFRTHILDLDKSDLDKICENVGQSGLAKKYKNKSRLVDKLFENVPVHKILESGVLQRKLREKPALKRDIRKIESAIKALSRDCEQMLRSDSESLQYVQKIQERLQQLIGQQEELTAFLGMKASPDTMAFLELFRRELVSLDEPLSPEKLFEIIERVQKKLNTDELSFILKGLEIMLSHYLLSQVKNMQWPPDFQEFVRIIREEIPKIQILPNQAEIPALRERVSQRLGISDSAFDDQLIQAWKKGYVKLEVGAPIGRGKVNYLKYGQSEYFYVKLL